MISVIYEDRDVIVVKKPAGLESQSSRSFAPDMVSEIRRYLSQKRDIHKLPTVRNASEPPYVGVVHRLDKPVGGVMVYGKNQKAAASLCAALQEGKMKKFYLAVVCGKLVDKQGAYVDYLRQDRKNNTSCIVDKSVKDSKKGVLNYKVLEVIHREEPEEKIYSLIDIELLTGRHHQIRVQMAGHGAPVWGDSRYGERISTNVEKESTSGGLLSTGHLPLALWAYSLKFPHPATGKICSFELKPTGGAFDWFSSLR
ncbi:MAG: RluA family pseudouridine synthase [Clostridium sp.]|nr:RluA family pseudouridine synthase [Clostridium sp.]